MAKKKYKKGDAQKGPKVNEGNRKTITQLLKQFLLSNDEVFTFESNLSDRERAIVHLSCRKLGMKSKSSGRGQQRQVSVYKSTTKDDQKKSKVIPNLTFSDDSKEILHSLFTRYPPDDGDMLKEMMGKRSFETDKDNYGGDDFFHRPSMGNEEVLKKMESLASRMERAADLKKITAERSRLPIISYRDIITSTVESNQVVLISGETGCGKTTQVPQFLLDNMWGKGQACKIVCTQPRRISATSVAERISRERGENVGDDIGYKIRLESKGGRHSSVVFCTNGILLRVLVSKGIAKSKKRALKKNMNHVASQITHIIVDEIHERDRYSDFMLTIIRDMLPAFPHLRLILMSATIDAERFSHYFGGCPIIRVPGFTYPVKSFYLEDIISVLKTSSHNHIDNAAFGVTTREQELSEEDKVALDKAIDSALSNDDYDVLLDLVSSGPSQVLNYQHSLTGVTPLMVFSGKGEVSNVCNLLTVGADCQLKDKDGFTALDWAERHNQREAAEVIRKHWESINASSFQTQQLLHKYLAMVNPEQIDVILIEQVVWKICLDSQEGAILVFLPGWDDINSTRERLLNNQYFKDASKFLVLSLHSMVPAAEQKKVFKRPPRGCRKIILSTNIAETAITIDDVVYVIDSGRMKEKSYDPYNNVSTLQSSWVSKASAKQREGRAGRCQPGMCYHLYSRERAASLPEFQVPEIKRTPVDELCLQVKLLDPNCSIDEFLRKTMDPPVPEAIRNAVAVLQEIGALSSNENLTILGEKLGSLPVHPLTSKMLLFAILMNCLDPALTLACASDYKDPFTLPMFPNQRYKADAAKRELSSLYGGYSDQLAVVAAFECWTNAKKRGQETRFCTDCFISPSTMRMIKSMRNQLLSELIRNGFIQEDISSCSLNARDPGILHAVLTSGLYPRVGKLVTGSRRRNQITVETANGENVRLVPHSIVSKLSFKGDNDIPLVLYDEITRGDWDLNIKNCSIVGPLPLIMIATDIAVAPSENIKGDDADGSKIVSGEDQSDLDKTDIDNNSSGEKEGIIMASPGNSVTVVVDRWLYFGLTALEIAQIYCLKERLSAAILFKVTHPRKVLPPVLGASVYAVACILSYDGLPRISSLSNSTGMMNSKEDGKSLKMFLRSLASHGAHGSSTSQNKHFNPPLFDSMAYRSDSRNEYSGPPPYQNLPFPSQNPPFQQHKIDPLPLERKFQAQQELQDWPPQDQKTEPLRHEGKPQAQQLLQQECPPPQDQKAEPPPHEGKPQGQQEQQEWPPQDQKTEPLQRGGKTQALQEEQGCAPQDQKTQPLPQIEQPKAKKKRRRPKKKPPVQQDPSPSLHLQKEQPVPSLNGCEPNSSRGDSLKRMRDELK